MRLEWQDAQSYMLHRYDIPWNVHAQGLESVLMEASSYAEEWCARWEQENVRTDLYALSR